MLVLEWRASSALRLTSVILDACLKPYFLNAAANQSLNSLMLTIDLPILVLASIT